MDKHIGDFILAIDPGNEESAFCFINKWSYEPIYFAKMKNREAIEAIGIGAAITFTILIIIIGYNVLNKGEETVNVALEQNDNLTTQLIESKYTKYDGATVTGSDVLNCIKSLKGEVICITVNNGKQVTEYLYNSTLTNDLTEAK